MNANVFLKISNIILITSPSLEAGENTTSTAEGSYRCVSLGKRRKLIVGGHKWGRNREEQLNSDQGNTCLELQVVFSLPSTDLGEYLLIFLRCRDLD